MLWIGSGIFSGVHGVPIKLIDQLIVNDQSVNQSFNQPWHLVIRDFTRLAAKWNPCDMTADRAIAALSHPTYIAAWFLIRNNISGKGSYQFNKLRNIHDFQTTENNISAVQRLRRKGSGSKMLASTKRDTLCMYQPLLSVQFSTIIPYFAPQS